MRKLQRALITTVLEAAGNGSAKACWALMRRAKADNFASAIDVSKAAPRQVVTLRKSKKADRYWSASPGAKPPVIPVAKIGYVRRSEVMDVRSTSFIGSHGGRIISRRNGSGQSRSLLACL